MSEPLTDVAAGFAIEDAMRRSVERDRRKWQQRTGPDFTDIASALRELGYVIVRKEP